MSRVLKAPKPQIPASRDYHPSKLRGQGSRKPPSSTPAVSIPKDEDRVILPTACGRVRLTNLRRLFWPTLGLVKGDLLQYYADIAPALLPHLRNRAMVMKRYPSGAHGGHFFMKRAPSPRPRWIPVCSIQHASGNVIDFPVIQDLRSLLWAVNLGCIDLNPWHARCGDVDRPDYLYFDLDPVQGEKEVPFEQIVEAALLVRERLSAIGMPSYVKTTGSRGIHIYVPLVRGPTQKQVWAFAKRFARNLAALRPDVFTSEYRVGRRPEGRVLLDYNQNAWGRTLVSVYSVRPHPSAAVSTPVAWEELEEGVRIEDFVITNVPDRLRRIGDLWQPILQQKSKVKLERFW